MNRWNQDARLSLQNFYLSPHQNTGIASARRVVARTLSRTDDLDWLKREAANMVNNKSERMQDILNDRGFYDASVVEAMYFELGVFQMFDTWINSFSESTGELTVAYAGDPTEEYEEVTTSTMITVEYNEFYDNGSGPYNEFYDRGYGYGR